MTRTKHDKIVTNYIDAVYVENETKLPCQIGPGAVYDKN